jgi:hypothetical protein
MEDVKIDQASMERLANALAFICGKDHATTIALRAASESGKDADIKKARALFLKLKAGERTAALNMLAG